MSVGMKEELLMDEEEKEDDFCCMCGPLDFGRPTQKEAYALSLISLLVSFGFGGIAVFYSVTGDDSSAIVSDAVGSGLDLVSGVLIVWRFQASNALEPTPRNKLIEARVTVALAFLMVLLSVALISVGISHMAMQDQPNHARLCDDVVLSFPSAVLYLVVGMMQLQMGCILRLQSLVFDGLISFIGALCSLSSLLAAMVNLLTQQYSDPSCMLLKDNILRPANRGQHHGNPYLHWDTPRAYHPHPQSLQEHDPLLATRPQLAVGHDHGLSESDNTINEINRMLPTLPPVPHDLQAAPPGGGATPGELVHSLVPLGLMTNCSIGDAIYPYSYLEDVFSVVLSIVLLAAGVLGALREARAGHLWWTSDFWLGPLPPSTSLAPRETTPLKA